MECKICGHAVAEWRQRSRMTLCDDCHKTTPAKATFEDFADIVTGGGRHMVSLDILREFFSDYKASTYGDVRAYWESCSA